MPRRIGWFDMLSKQQEEKRQERYENKMFPLGPKQKDKEMELLKELLPNMPVDQSLYYLLQFKEIVASEDREDDFNDWSKTNLAKKLSDDNRKLIWEVALDSANWKSLDDILSAKTIKEKLNNN